MKSSNDRPKSGGPKGKGGFKGDWDKPFKADKPFNTRTYHRPAAGPQTEGFDAGADREERTERNESPAGGMRYQSHAGGAKRYQVAGKGPARGKAEFKRSVAPADRPYRPRRQADETAPRWAAVEPRADRDREGGPELAEAGHEPRRQATGKSGDLVELVLAIPAPLLHQLESRAREIGVEVGSLAQVWLADKLAHR